MGSKGSREYRALQRERERRRRQQWERSSAQQLPPLDGATPEVSSWAVARRATATTCGWCHRAITPRSRGPLPKWCSATCRHRAWEQARAAASGHLAVRVVERQVEAPTPIAPTRRNWPRLLDELVRQLNDGRVYDRD